MDSQRKSISLSTATSQQPEKGLNEKNSDDLSLPGLLKKENCNAIHIDSIDEESLESMPSSESLLYDTRTKLLSSDPLSLLTVTPISLSTASSTASLPSIDTVPSAHIPHAADISVSILTSANHPTISLKAMEDTPELMVVMTRIESSLLSVCKRVSMVLQEAIRQREETTLTNDIEIRNFNESNSMNQLKKYEEERKVELEELEFWYEEEVRKVENAYTEQLDACEKELEAYRSDCFVKAEKKEEELEKELKDDPPERAARIRSQVLERFHNKLIEGEQSIQQRRQEIKHIIQHGVKDLEREYQKRRKDIDREFHRITRAIKTELTEKKHTIKSACEMRRETARAAHSSAIETCRDILREMLQQTRDLLKAYEEAYLDGFPISSIYLASSIINQTAGSIIKKIHLFCDIRVHEQLKRMTSIQNEIDSFQTNCDNIIMNEKHAIQSDETPLETLRGDQFLQTTMRLQSELIGRALLEIDDTDNTGFHSHITTLREQFAEEIHSANQEGKKRGWRGRNKDNVDTDGLKKKYLSQVVQHAQEELQLEYKRCVQDMVDFASNSAKLFYREMAIRYWLLMTHYKERGDDDTIYESLTAANQEIIERFTITNGKKGSGINPVHSTKLPAEDARSEQQFSTSTK